MKEKIALGIFVFSLSMILVLVVYSQSSITGQSITEHENDTNNDIAIINGMKNERSCTDSDNGKNYAVVGSIRVCSDNGACVTDKDFCSGKNLVEYYCAGMEKNYEDYTCEFDCDNGACLHITTNYSYRRTSTGGGGGGGGSSSSGSGSSGGGASVPSISTGQTFTLGTLDAEKIIDIATADIITFIRANTTQTFVAQQADTAALSLEINGNTFVSLAIGEEQEIDITGDTITDVRIKPRSFNLASGRVTLLLTPLP